MNPIFAAFAGLYALNIAIELLLERLNLSNIDKHADEVPPLFKDKVSLAEYKKSIAYTKAKTRFGNVTTVVQTALIWFLILAGIFGVLDQWLQQLLPSQTVIRGLVYFGVVGFGFYLVNLPLGIYSQFVLEERFGFNRMSARTFVFDQIKAGILAVVLGAPLLGLLLWLVLEAGDSWWIYGFVGVILFQFATAALFPVLLAPIFYKFTPLPEGELKDRIEALAKKLDFEMAGIYTIDGSKRSAHSNAFFAGIGRFRRIVLFDTLLSSLTTDEIVAVIAHEIGHNKKNHIVRMLMISFVSTFVSFAVLAYCLKWPLFFQAFGAYEPSVYVGFMLFALFAGVFTFPLTPLFNWLSRKHEYEADAFSVETTGDRASMTQALVKLAKDNLSNLTPHPWFSAYHYSHPTTQERAERIRESKKPI